MDVRRTNPKKKYYSVRLRKSVDYEEYISSLGDKLHVCENCQETYGSWSEALDMYICDSCDPPKDSEEEA